MIEFSSVTAFGLVRRLGAAGPLNPAIYLLVCEAISAEAVKAELRAEVEVQLDAAVHTETASELHANALTTWEDGSIRILYFDRWFEDLVDALDHHVPVLVQDGGQLLLLATSEIAERLLRRAPNLRNRLTNALKIEPDDLSGGGQR